MRHLMLALMIVLLPLRGWTGDAMATQMASSMAATAGAEKSARHQHAPQAEATTTRNDMTMNPAEPLLVMHDCAGHAAAAVAAVTADSEQNVDAQDTLCGSCEACQACHTIALFNGVGTAHLFLPLPRASASPEALFISADAALNQKPPIS